MFYFFGLLFSEISTAEKLVNLAYSLRNATCSSNFGNSSDIRYKCENALEPEWHNINDWYPECLSGECSNKNINVYFNGVYDVDSICISQAMIAYDDRVTDIQVTFKNPQNYSINGTDTLSCFLLSFEDGINQSNFTITLLNGDKPTFQGGFNSIMVLGYTGGLNLYEFNRDFSTCQLSN